jgi:hypothetical protein
MRAILPLLFWGLLQWASSVAHASAQESETAPPTPEDNSDKLSASARAQAIEAGRAHFVRGVQLYRSAAYDAALAEFSRAYESAPNYRILYNLAQIQAERHDDVAALKLFERYLADGATGISEARASEVEAEMTELGRRICRLRVDTNADGARLFINQILVGELPIEEALLVNAGMYRLRVEKAGYLPAGQVVTLTSGEELTLELELTAELETDSRAIPPTVNAPPASLPSSQVHRTALWASLGTTAAFTGASLSFGLLTRQANTRIDRLVETYPARHDAIDKARSRARSFATLTDAFGIAAATALGFSAYYYFSGQEEHEPVSLAGFGAQIDSQGSRVSWRGNF